MRPCDICGDNCLVLWRHPFRDMEICQECLNKIKERLEDFEDFHEKVRGMYIK